MFFSKIKIPVLFAALSGAALACGPDFPSTIIDNPDALLAAPYARYADSLTRIHLPPAEFHAVSGASDKSPATLTIAAELTDLAAAGVPAELIAQHRIRRSTLAGLVPLPAGLSLPAELAKTEGLPAEFAEYHAAACAFIKGDLATATQVWQHLLSRPAPERRYKSAWATFMLGRTAANEGEARAYYQETRQLVREGFVDTLGLASASLGWEAKTWLDAGDLSRAAQLYLAQFATGDPTAANSLRCLATRVLGCGNDAVIQAFAADVRLREVITALLLCEREEELYQQSAEGLFARRTGTTAHWLKALEKAGANDASGAARLALMAYRAGEFDLTERWLKLAPGDDAIALWLRAKLAVRRGDLEGAARDLSALVHSPSALADRLGDLCVYESSEQEPASAERHLLAELGALKLASRDYREALDLLLRSKYWEDAAYIAENVFTVDELKTYVDAQGNAPGAAAKRTADRCLQPQQDLRHVLARRLVRHDRMDEARPYFPETIAPIFDRFLVLLHAGQDHAQPDAVRAAALMEAARLMRAEGMALRGTELEPDYAIWEGCFSGGINLLAREKLSGPLRPSSDEHARASVQEPGAGRRFHYRYTAANLAWSAVLLMPDESEATARALIEAGGWLKARDPHAANPFYLALVRRCGRTMLGASAARKHWFPSEAL